MSGAAAAATGGTASAATADVQTQAAGATGCWRPPPTARSCNSHQRTSRHVILICSRPALRSAAFAPAGEGPSSHCHAVPLFYAMLTQLWASCISVRLEARRRTWKKHIPRHERQTPKLSAKRMPPRPAIVMSYPCGQRDRRAGISTRLTPTPDGPPAALTGARSAGPTRRDSRVEP